MTSQWLLTKQALDKRTQPCIVSASVLLGILKYTTQRTSDLNSTSNPFRCSASIYNSYATSHLLLISFGLLVVVDFGVPAIWTSVSDLHSIQLQAIACRSFEKVIIFPPRLFLLFRFLHPQIFFSTSLLILFFHFIILQSLKLTSDALRYGHNLQKSLQYLMWVIFSYKNRVRNISPCLHHPRRSSWFWYSGMGIPGAPPTVAYAPNVPNAHSTDSTHSRRQLSGKELWRYKGQSHSLHYILHSSSFFLPKHPLPSWSFARWGTILLDWELAPEIYSHLHQLKLHKLGR